MASYFDELGINSATSNRRRTYDVDLNDFMNPSYAATDADSQVCSSLCTQTISNVICYSLFSQMRQQMQVGDEEVLVDNLVSQLLEESQNNIKGPPPASKRFIQSLPRIDTTAFSCIYSDESCIICKDSLKGQSGVTRMPCGHYYDHDCIVPWLELHNTCPMCRYEVETEKKVEEEEEEEQRGWMYG
ncbi:hypothetical protein BDB01DRAFT_842272 [Pilobolus umbonatus]|nr:hypothetical protein BDB01DRAFT_842272 [Pilobolus umbonatus]